VKIKWTCPHCLKTEETSPRTCAVYHIHGDHVELLPYKKPRKPHGVVTVKSLKEEVWDLFSEYVRRSESDEHGYCKCVTCGKIDHWKDMQAGHFIHGTLFIIPELVHVQCRHCNGFKAGNAILYKEFMLTKYGQKTLDKLEFLAKRRHSFTIFELEQYKKLYKQKLEELD
jgi:Bacteriophage Lambda NinG protein